MEKNMAVVTFLIPTGAGIDFTAQIGKIAALQKFHCCAAAKPNSHGLTQAIVVPTEREAPG
jgi:hypothetical protein